MSAELEGFVREFVIPMIGGGKVAVRAPISTRERDAMLADASSLHDPELRFALLRRAQTLVADPPMSDPGSDDLSLWLGLHNILALDHPDTERVWTRSITWRRVESETRTLLAFARPTDMAAALSKHLALGAFLALRREDHIVEVGEGERRHVGRAPLRSRWWFFGSSPEPTRVEVVQWIEQAHNAASDRLLSDAMWSSPLTCLLRPAHAPPSWSPLKAADFLQVRGFARAVCHAWAREREWLKVGGVIAGSLLASLGMVKEVFPDLGPPPRAPVVAQAGELTAAPLLALPGETLDDDPALIGAVLGALIHLHLLKVLEFDARIGLGVGARDWAVQSFLALPLLLPALEPVLGSPLAHAKNRSAARRFEEYTDHLRGLVPRTVVQNLLATLVSRIVESDAA